MLAVDSLRFVLATIMLGNYPLNTMFNSCIIKLIIVNTK